MKFGEALKMSKRGNSLQRKGWIGTNKYVYLVPRFGPMMEYLRMRVAGDQNISWTISQTDVLADDWITTEAP